MGGAARHAPGALLSAQLRERAESDLAPIAAPDAPRELQPLLDALNQVMRASPTCSSTRSASCATARHQLRTPLAVLKTQVQSALRGDVEPTQALQEMRHTVERATQLANQMLLAGQGRAVAPGRRAGGRLGRDRARGGAGPRRAHRRAPARLRDRLDAGTPVRAHEWMLRELTRNLLHNAIRHCREGGTLAMARERQPRLAALTIADSGPGLPPDCASTCSSPSRPASVAAARASLAIAAIVRTLSGGIALDDRVSGGRVVGSMPRCACRWRTISCDERRRHEYTACAWTVAVGGALHKTRALAAEEIIRAASRSTARRVDLARVRDRRCDRDPCAGAAGARHGQGPGSAVRGGARRRGNSRKPRTSRSARRWPSSAATAPSRRQDIEQAGRPSATGAARRVGSLERVSATDIA